MTNTYTWTVKNLNKDQRGYANTLYLEMSGTDGTNTAISNVVCTFGGSDYKPFDSWLQSDIDSYAEQHTSFIQEVIDARLSSSTLPSNSSTPQAGE